MQGKGNQTAYIVALAARAPGGVISWAEARALYLEASALAGVPHVGFRRHSYSSPLRAVLTRHFVQVIPDAEVGTRPAPMARSLFILKAAMEASPEDTVENMVQLALFRSENETDQYGMSTGRRRDPIDLNLAALKLHMQRHPGGSTAGIRRMSQVNAKEEQ